MAAPASPPPPPPERSTTEEAVRAATGAIVAAVVELLRAVREEVGRMQRAAVRSLDQLRRAAGAFLLAVLLVALGVVLLAVFLVAWLNHVLGDPWGTGLAALALLAAGGLAWMRSRAALRAMEREAEGLMGRRAR